MAERPEDLNLPTSIVTKIIKDCLPNTCKVSKEANAAIAKVKRKGRTVLSVSMLYTILHQAASVFVLYATSSANTAAQKSNRKTITGGDVISAMSDMEFEKVTIIHNIHIITFLRYKKYNKFGFHSNKKYLFSIHILRNTNQLLYMRIDLGVNDFIFSVCETFRKQLSYLEEESEG